MSVSVNDAQLAAARVLPTQTASAQAPAASPAPARQPGFSGRSSFDPVSSTQNALNSQSSGRSDLAQGFWRGQEGILARSNATTDWHKLRMEMIALLK